LQSSPKEDELKLDDAEGAVGPVLTGDLLRAARLDLMGRQQQVDAFSRRRAFLLGVFFITCAILVFQITQMRILSVVAWYYLAFFAISVAMLGMTVGAVWVYLKRREFTPERLSIAVSDAALMAAVAMPASLVVQFCLITKLLPTVASAAAWLLLMAAMTVPYFFAGIAVTLALTRSPFPVSQVYGVDLLGAATGCIAAVAILNFLDGPSAVVLAGLLAAIGASFFARSASQHEAAALAARRGWRRPFFVSGALLALVLVNFASPFGLKTPRGQGCIRNRMAYADGALELLFARRGLSACQREPAPLGSISPARQESDHIAGPIDHRRGCGHDDASFRSRRSFAGVPAL
jgi:hypothetical protein